MSDKTSPKFIDFLRGRLSRVNLPQKIELSKDLWQVMDKLWHTALHYYYLSQGMQDKQAVYYTNLDICQTYKIAFYAGRVFQPLWEIYQP